MTKRWLPWQWRRRTATCSVAIALAGTCCGFLPFGSITAVFGQGMSGSGGSQVGAPAFEEVKFKDRLYQRGGRRLASGENGLLIKDVIVEGNQTISYNNIMSMIQSRPDRIFDDVQLQRDIASMWQTGFFQDVRPTVQRQDEGIVLRIKVVERPTVLSVVFHGNKAVSDGTLTKQCGLRKGDPISPQTALSTRATIESYYQTLGFNNATVSVYRGNNAGERDVIFAISEGELERFDHITFVGNRHFSSDILRTKISSGDSHRYHIPNLTSYSFNRASLDAAADDQRRLVEYYRALGYFDARVGYTIDYAEDGKYLDVTFVISEGERYNVRNVTIEGNRYFTTEKLQAYFELNPGAPYHLGKKNTDEKFLRDAYGTVGFIYADIVASVFVLPDNEVDITYLIDEGDVYRCSEINVHINGDVSYTKERVVLLNLGNLRPGEIIDAVEVENAERRLKGSSIFETNPTVAPPPRIEIARPFDLEPENY